MTLLDPRHTDTADLLSLIRDIGGRLDGISERLTDISERLDSIEDDSIERIKCIEDDTAEISCKLSMIAQLLTGAGPAGMSTGPNGQASDRDIALACRAASRQLYVAATAAHELADSLLNHGPWPTMAAEIGDLATDLKDLARQVALITKQRERDNESNERKDDR